MSRLFALLDMILIHGAHAELPVTVVEESLAVSDALVTLLTIHR